MMISSWSPTGSSCLMPVPKRLPIPAAMISSVVDFVVFISLSSFTHMLFYCVILLLSVSFPVFHFVSNVVNQTSKKSSQCIIENI